MKKVLNVLLVVMIVLTSCSNDYSFDVSHEVKDGKYHVYVYSSEGLENSAWSQEIDTVVNGEALRYPKTIGILHINNPDTLVFDYLDGQLLGKIKDVDGHQYIYKTSGN